MTDWLLFHYRNNKKNTGLVNRLYKKDLMDYLKGEFFSLESE